MSDFWEISQCRVRGFLHKWKASEDMEICERCFCSHYAQRNPNTGEISRIDDVRSHKREMLQVWSPEYKFEKDHE